MLGSGLEGQTPVPGSTTRKETEMRRVIGIILLAVTLVIGNYTLTSANASGNDDDVIRLIAKSVVAETLDLGDKGESVGDQEIFSDDLYWAGKKVGTLDGSCTTTRARATFAMLNCTVTLTLPNGQITLQGAVRFDRNFTGKFFIAITGGTGDYDTAQGQVKVEFVTDTRTKLTVMLG
jgi:hypothetical protein